MKRFAFSLGLALVSTAAWAQMPGVPDTTAPTQRTDTNSTIRRPAGDKALSGGVETRVRTRVDGGIRAGVETREHTGVTVHRTRAVREVEEPSVTVRRRHTVTTYDEPDTVVHRTVVKKKPTATKVVVKSKKKKPTKVVVKKRRHYVVHEPVEVRRRTVHRYQVDEPSVSVTRRTVRHVHEETPRIGVSVEQRRHDVNVSTRRSTAPETTGSVTTRSRISTESGVRSNSSGSTNLRLHQPGNSSPGGSMGQ